MFKKSNDDTNVVCYDYNYWTVEIVIFVGVAGF